MSGQGSGGGGALVLLLGLWLAAVIFVVAPLGNAEPTPSLAPGTDASAAPSPSPTPDLTFGLACATDAECAEPVTRAEMAGALASALGVPASGADAFTDDDGIEQEPAIDALATAGLIGGCSEDRFCPDAGATRAELAAILVRAFEVPRSGPDAFDDDNGHQFEAQIDAIAAAGFTGGCGDRLFCPDGEVSRQALRDLLTRIVALIP